MTSYAQALFEHLGLAVDPIPEADVERSDFLVSIQGCVALVEEKTKVDNPAVLKQQSEALDRGELVASHIPLRYSNRHSGIIRKAVKQLESSKDFDHNFRLVFLTGTGQNAEAHYEQFFSTIYGTTNVIEFGTMKFTLCYFFRNSEFFRCAETLDGAILASVHGSSVSATLCVNPLSPRSAQFLASPIAKAFGSAVKNPHAEEAEGTAYMADTTIDRRNISSVLDYVQTKYGTQPLDHMDLGQHTAYVSAAR